MIEPELPEGSPVEVPLDLRTVRGRPVPNAPARLAGRVVVGRPRSRRLAADAGADQGLQQFIESEASKWDYHLIALSCTFVSDDEQRLADAWLRVNLSNPDNASDSPVVHSMEPVTLEEIRELSYSVKLSVPCILNSEISWGNKKNKREAAVQALYEGTSTPTWTFAEKSTLPLHGLQRLRMVVRAPGVGAGVVAVNRTAILACDHRRAPRRCPGWSVTVLTKWHCCATRTERSCIGRSRFS